MTEHTFTLILNRPPTDDELDGLYEAGCDDALLGSTDGVAYAEFDRDADTLADAVMSAIHDVETVAGLRAVRIEPDDLVTAAEIAKRLGRSRESIRLLAAGRRGEGFPAPVSHARERVRLWRWTDVLAWSGHDVQDASVVAAANAALELRARAPTLDASRRRAIEELART